MHIPRKMLVVDVAPRDGLQSLPKWIPTDDKVWLCDRLTDLGVPVVIASQCLRGRVELGRYEGGAAAARAGAISAGDMTAEAALVPP